MARKSLTLDCLECLRLDFGDWPFKCQQGKYNNVKWIDIDNKIVVDKCTMFHTESLIKVSYYDIVSRKARLFVFKKRGLISSWDYFKKRVEIIIQQVFL